MSSIKQMEFFLGKMKDFALKLLVEKKASLKWCDITKLGIIANMKNKCNKIRI